jgi:predicted nucleotidyltransferase
LGKTKIYSINRKHFLFSPLQKLFINLNIIYRKIAQETKNFVVKKNKHIQTIILMGSLAQDKIRDDFTKEPSDIDLIFIVKSDKFVKAVKESLFDYINKRVSLRYGISLYPFAISQKEYLKRLNRKDPFILESYIKGEIFYGEKPRRFS